LGHVYEPTFSANSHAFRMGRSCHTALSQIKKTWTGLVWCLKGNFTGFFGQMDDLLLLKLISKRIDDRRFLLLIHHALLSGAMEEWTEHEIFSGTQEGGIFFPLIANIYLHEFDLFIDQLIEQFANGNMKYVRYAEDFVVGITGPKRTALRIQGMIKDFLEEELQLMLNDDQILITHLKNPVSFLGYQFSRRGERQVLAEPQKPPLKTKTIAGAISLEIPKNQMKEFASKNGYGNLDNFNIIHRKSSESI
jgi:retron-type reverse transcriptase